MGLPGPFGSRHPTGPVKPPPGTPLGSHTTPPGVSVPLHLWETACRLLLGLACAQSGAGAGRLSCRLVLVLVGRGAAPSFMTSGPAGVSGREYE